MKRASMIGAPFVRMAMPFVGYAKNNSGKSAI
jgi:hypothetical protein